MAILLTGATGLVGRYLVRDLLSRGVRLAVLVRSRGATSAQERLDNILTFWEGELGRRLPEPMCLEGDITEEGLGLNKETRSWVARNCEAVLHNAACLTFMGKDRTQEPWRSNLQGVSNVLEFCRQTGLRELHHVSTAYVCGRRTDTVFEGDLDDSPEFRNDYEQSKYEAEKLVRAASFLDSLTVYRPAVIVGDSQSGYTSTYHGLYSYLQFVSVLVRYLQPQPDGRYHVAVRINLTGDEARNLVPVDWVSAVIAHIALAREHHGRTYHLAPEPPPRAWELQEAMLNYFKLDGPILAGPNALAGGDLNSVEEMFYSYVERYQPYWNEEPVFDCSNTRAAAPHLPSPHLDQACLQRLIDFAVRDQWGKRSKREGKEESVAARETS